MITSLRRPLTVSLLTVSCMGMTLWGFWPSSGKTDLLYGTADNVPLTLDLDFPSPRGSSSPVILLLLPDSMLGASYKHERRCQALITKLTRQGYAVATPRYRPPGLYHFPAQVEDLKTAVRWLRASAGRYRLDTGRIGVVGVSSGGWGACMLGTTDAQDGFEGPGDNADQSSRVQAVVCIGVPGDFAIKTWTDGMERLFLQPLLGARYDEAPELYERASPAVYASEGDPPFLLFHSREDCVVPVEMARIFAARLHRAGVSVELVETPGMEHIWNGAKFDGALEQTLAFFDRHLR
ncbi:MAG TPA: alpha/beta hydrolase [Gemmataceae bacterium]|nr:alpha/beta hydrolase [Gemmataceae bacterium]